MDLELELTIDDPDYEVDCEIDETIDMGTKIINPITITKNGVYKGGVSNGKQVGYSPVTVDVKPNPVPLTVTENGVHENEQGFSPVTVDVPKNYHEVVKMIINSTEICNYFFRNSTLSDVSEFLRYDTTENAINTMGLFQFSQIKCCPSLNLGKVTACTNMFAYANELDEVFPRYTPNMTSTVQMFNYATNLKKIHELDFRSVTDARYTFSNCKKLTECYIKNIKTNLQVGSGSTYGHLLTVESLIYLIKELRDTGSLLTLTMGSINIDKLANIYVRTVDITDEMRAEDDLIDEKLPFEVCESTDEGAMLITDYVALKNWEIK